MRLRISVKKRNRVNSNGLFAARTRERNEEPIANGGVSELGDEICLKSVTPECFYRGSISELAWIPAQNDAGMSAPVMAPYQHGESPCRSMPQLRSRR